MTPERITPPRFDVLLVEDAPDQAFLLKVMIEKMGPYRVTVVQDGERALEAASSGAPDLVVTDLNLPALDGFQLTADLKRRRPDLPIVAVTAYDNPAHLEGARRAGADAVLRKPVDADELGARLQGLLSPLDRDPDAQAVATGGAMAIGFRPGDLELGCGGSLLTHAAAGRNVTTLVLSGPGDSDAAAERLGARALHAAATDAPGALRALAAAVRSEQPGVVYVPSPRDHDATRSVLFEAAREALQGVRRVLGYATVTSTLDFRPDHFEEVGTHIAAKRAALEALAREGCPELPPPEFLEAHARYWGRASDFGVVEPFEILRDSKQP